LSPFCPLSGAPTGFPLTPLQDAAAAAICHAHHIIQTPCRAAIGGIAVRRSVFENANYTGKQVAAAQLETCTAVAEGQRHATFKSIVC
jgi:hypothetical protein